MNSLISLFIDDELTLDDKVTFVETVHAQEHFKDDTVALLNQEKLLRSDVVGHVPDIRLKGSHRVSFWRLRPVYALGTALAAVLLLLVSAAPRQEQPLVAFRFVIYQP